MRNYSLAIFLLFASLIMPSEVFANDDLYCTHKVVDKIYPSGNYFDIIHKLDETNLHFDPNITYMRCKKAEKFVWRQALLQSSIYTLIGVEYNTPQEAVAGAASIILTRRANELDPVNGTCSDCQPYIGLSSSVNFPSSSNNRCSKTHFTILEYNSCFPQSSFVSTQGVGSWNYLADSHYMSWGRFGIVNHNPEQITNRGSTYNVYRYLDSSNYYPDLQFSDNVIINQPVCDAGWLPGMARDENNKVIYTCYLSTATARAQGMSGLDANLEGCGVSCNPVNLSTGDKIDYAEDFRNRSPFPIIWDRYYLSAAGKWTFGYERNLKFSENNASGTQYVEMNRPDGAKVLFKKTASTWELDNLANKTIKSSLTSLMSGASLVGFSYRNLLDETENYNLTGQLTSIVSKEGHAIEFTYNNNGHLTLVEDDFGQSLTITRSPVDQFGKSWVIAVDDGNRLVSYDQSLANSMGSRRVLLNSVHYPDNTQIEYEYDGGTPSKGLLTGITDKNGIRRSTYTYDQFSRVSSSVHDPNGSPVNEIEYTYGVFDNATGISTEITWADGSAKAGTAPNAQSIPKLSGFDAHCTVCVGGDKRSIQYDAKGNPTTFTNFEGMITNTTYDMDRGLMTSSTEAVGTSDERTSSTVWHSTYRIPLSITEDIEVGGAPHTRTTTFIYNANHQPTSKTVSNTAGGANRTWIYTYNPQKLLESVTDPMLRTTIFLYDSQGNMTSTEDAEGLVSSYQYTSDGYISQQTAPNGLKTKLTYDDMRRITKVERGSFGTHWETTQFTYTLEGRVARVDHPSGYWQEHTYTATGKTESIKDSKGIQTFEYDSMNRLIQQQTDRTSDNNLITQKTYSYNAQGDLETEGTFEYEFLYARDNEGRITQADNNFTNTTTQNSFDQFGRLTSFLDEAATQYTTAYDPQDQLISATDSRGNGTLYSYNGFGDLTSVFSPDAGTQSFVVNANGEVVSKTDGRGAQMSITRDDIGRPTQIMHSSPSGSSSLPGFKSGNETQTFFYDTCINGAGKLCSMTDGSGTTQYQYDLWGRIAAKSFTPIAASFSLTTGYTYSNTGNLTAITYPSGRALAISNIKNDPTNLDFDGYNILNNATYEPFGGSSLGWDWGGGMGLQAYETILDVFHFMTGNINRTNIKQGANREEFYDDDTNAHTHFVSYDNRSQVISATYETKPERSYAYDANKNRTQSIVDQSFTTDYQHESTSNRLTSFSTDNGPGHNWTYDASGNLIAEPGNQYLYDAKGRMAEAAVGSHVMTYAYNAQGKRMRKTRTNGANAGTDHFVYDEEGRLLGVYDENGNPREEIVWFDGWRPVATIRGSAVAPDIYRITSDHLGAPLSVMDDNGVVVWEWDGREPFGFQMPNQDPDGDSNYFYLNMRFAGQWFDYETGLYHNGFRDYHPKVGRYIQSDPIGLEGGWNTYAYVSNNPVNFIDPEGLIQKDSFVSNQAPVEVCHGLFNCARMLKGTMKTDLGNEFSVWRHVDGSNFLKQNCHAYAFGVEGWINDPTQVYKDEYNEVSAEEEADLIFWHKNGVPYHSSIISSPINRGKSGSFPPGYDPKFIHFSKTPVFYKKSHP